MKKNINENISLNQPVLDKGNQIRENKTIPANVKKIPKFKLDVYDNIQEYFKQQLEPDNIQNSRVELVRAFFGHLIPKKEEGVTTLLELLTLPDDSPQIMQFIHSESNKADRHSLALALRLHNFRLYLLSIYGLYINAPIESPTIKFSVDAILQALASREIYLDLSKSKIVNFNAKGEKVPPTHIMTVDMITRFTVGLAKDLRALLNPLISCYNHGESMSQFFNLYKDPYISNIYNKYIPPGFTTAVPDYYYIFDLLARTDKISIFNENQYKQWCTYKAEIESLFKFMCVCNFVSPTIVQEFNQQWFNICSEFNKHTINQPFNKFINEPCSKNTFSRLIDVLNRLTPRLWQLTISMVFKVFPPDTNNT